MLGKTKSKSQRTKLAVDLKNHRMRVLDSHANFVLATLTEGNAEFLYLVKELGILVRYYKQAGLEDKLRLQLVRTSKTRR
jgi:histidinol-phosphate aminotransferase